MSLIDPPATQHFPNTVCPACCCLCDDIELTVHDGHVVEARGACAHGRAWFLAAGASGAQEQHATIDGAQASLDCAVAAAAELLRTAKYPLIFMLPGMSSEAQRAAIALADWCGAVIDTATSRGHAPSILGMQHAGKVTCTLGETRNRADLIVFWGTNVVAKYPRFFTRYSADAVGKFIPGGRADRTCVAIDVRATETTQSVDRALLIRPNADFEVLTVLRALLAGLTLDPTEVASQTGVALSAWQDLIDRMKSARFGSLVFGKGLMNSHGRQLNCDSLFRLVADLNSYTRFVCRSIRAAGNITGGDRTMTWQTGYPFGVNFARGFPRFGPGEYTANAMLARGEPDAVLIVGGDASEWLDETALEYLTKIPRIRIASGQQSMTASLSAASPRIAIRTARHALESAGTMFRMDDVPLVALAALASPLPSEYDVLKLLEARVRA
jgi:formylmethanofuran dehydrogenase subunit B